MLTLALTVLTVLALLQIKHLIVDWVWQPPYEFENKGTYGHWGGVRHALKNALGTGLVVWLGFHGLAGILLCLWITVLDFVIHYHIDYAKTNLNRSLALCPSKPPFWWALGADQTAHQLTYVFLTGYALLCALNG